MIRLVTPPGGKPLHPDTAAELIMRSTHLLQAVLYGVESGAADGGRGGWMAPGVQKEAMSMAALHVLCACRSLLRHISDQVRC